MADFYKNSLTCGKRIADKILVFDKYYEGGKLRFDFSTLAPIPMEYAESRIMTPEIREWLIDFWGTTSNALDCEVQFNEKDNIFTINFKTAWVIPKPIIKELSKVSGEDNFVWIAISETSDLMEIFTKNKQNKLEVKEIHHNINFYDKTAYDQMQDYLLINNQKEQEHNIR